MDGFNSHDESYHGRRTQRASLLVSMMALASLLFVGVLLVTLCGGVMLQALAVVAIVGLIGVIHYLTWGKAMSAEADAEREAELRSLLDEDDWNVNDQGPRGY